MVVMIIKMMMVITVMCMEGKVMDGSMIFLCAKAGGGGVPAHACVRVARVQTDRRTYTSNIRFFARFCAASFTRKGKRSLHIPNKYCTLAYISPFLPRR